MHAIIQEEQSLLGRLLLRIIVAEFSCWQHGVPVVEIRIHEIPKNGFEGSIVTFSLPIALRVISGRHAEFHSYMLEKGTPEVTREFRIPI